MIIGECQREGSGGGGAVGVTVGRAEAWGKTLHGFIILLKLKQIATYFVIFSFFNAKKIAFVKEQRAPAVLSNSVKLY